ncbi:MAG: MBL fold metallo-hydrolase [Erythrobacter sp.]|uniref:MBL fold metallo-hydrolase n=1 Tax=Erythrobacter sp. TaxID=1042 RepID=UPI001B0FDC13|nr:MBL fold metallo-hydrolase [Erythrobacter sp.]MBO6768214.1 MBL fold metallo-hydrolase [Erythrobacter sp.]
MARRIGIGFLLLLLVAVLIFLVGQRQIGERLYTRAVERNAGVDRVAEWPDGLHAYVCGSGSPMPDAQRAGPCIAVIAGQRAFIFDVGSGAIRKLQPLAFPMDRLDAAFLTHLHSDHFDSLGELMLQAWIAGQRDSPLPVYGPEGTDRVVAGFIEAYTIDRGFRIAHHGPEVARPGGFGAEARIIDAAGTAPHTVYQSDGVTIRAIRVDHRPVEPALAFRVEYAGRALVISGDTVRSEQLAQLARGADVLFHEALNPRMVGEIGTTLAERGNAAGAKIMADIPDYHTSPEDAARVAQKADVEALVLYHLVPPPPVSLIGPAFLGESGQHFDGRIELAKDGMLVSLSAREQSVLFDEML